MVDRSGTLWIGTGGGVSRLVAGEFTSFTSKEGLSGEWVFSLLEDREGSVWIGMVGGLNRLGDARITSFTEREGLPGRAVWSIHEDREGALWMGMIDGDVCALQDGKVTRHITKEELTGDAHLSKEVADAPAFLSDRNGNLWIGTIGYGLKCFREGRITSVVKAGEPAGGSVHSLVEDREGSLWIGTNRGLNRLKKGELISVTTRDGLSIGSVTALLEDREGTLWIGTCGGGLCRMPRNSPISPIKGWLSDDCIKTLLESQDGAVWIGTDSHGLTRLKDGKFSFFGTKEGLCDDRVWSLLEDGLGNLWMISNKGISRVSKDELNAVAEGKRTRLSCVAYGTSDGMKSREGSGLQGARSRDGNLWFPTMNGAVVIDPAHIPTNPNRPPVVIEEVLIDGKVADRPARGTPLELRPGTEKVELHYTANSFVLPKRVAFKYRLEGYDRAWVNAGGDRTAHYTKLPPRSYTFRVKACNNDGLWNEAGASLAFTVLPRFWQTWWFRGLESMAALGLLAGAFALQRRRLDGRKARELAEELRSAELARKTQELENARRVQVALLPKEPLTVGLWIVAGRMQTATEVGGDYYGYLEAGTVGGSAGAFGGSASAETPRPAGARLCVVIGDATGHGMASGLVAGMLKSALASLSRRTERSEGPAIWLDDLNAALRTSIAQRGLGVCVGIGLVDIETGEVELGMAGIPHPFHVSVSGAIERLALSGTPLGYLKRIVTATATRTLAPGDRLVLITDGLIEQVNRAGDEWGYAGVETTLAAICAGGAGAEEIAEGLLRVCEEFGTGQPRSDDRTVVVLARKRSGGAS